MQVRSLGWEDPPQEGTATHSSILAWEIPWTQERGGLRSIGSQIVGHDWRDLPQLKDVGVLPAVTDEDTALWYPYPQIPILTGNSTGY